jgi:hypothetical protein
VTTPGSSSGPNGHLSKSPHPTSAPNLVTPGAEQILLMLKQIEMSGLREHELCSMEMIELNTHQANDQTDELIEI